MPRHFGRIERRVGRLGGTVSVVIGWDIGGAHLKAARVRHGHVEAVVQAATPLWLGLDSLEAAFDALRTQLGRADRHVITMTGELCDAFPSRREGVAGLAAIAANHLAPAAPSLYAGRAGFVELGEAASSTPPTSPRPTGTRAPRSSRSSFETRCSSTSARRQPTSFQSSRARSLRSATATRNGSLRANSSIPE